MKARGWGRILNIASLQSQRAFADSAPYGAGKGGIVQLTRAIARGLVAARHHLQRDRPGLLPDRADRARSSPTPSSRERHAAQTCIGRNGAARRPARRDRVPRQRRVGLRHRPDPDGRRRLHREVRSRDALTALDGDRDEGARLHPARRNAAAGRARCRSWSTAKWCSRSRRSASAAPTCTPGTATIRAGSPALVLGHEFVGRIERSAAPGFEPGSRWTGNPLIVCGTCDYCVAGPQQPVREPHDGRHDAARRVCRVHEHPGAVADRDAAGHAERRTPRSPSRPRPRWHAINLSMRALARPLHECRVLVIGGGAIGMLAGAAAEAPRASAS